MYYEDDRFNPSNEEFEDASTNFSLSSDNNKRKKELFNLANSPNNNCVRYIVTDNNRKKHYVQCFPSIGGTGASIRHAISGAFFKEHKIGSKWEDLYFKARLSMLPKPVTVFYDSPEQCERHQRSTISSDVKEKWLKKNMEARELELSLYSEL